MALVPPPVPVAVGDTAWGAQINQQFLDLYEGLVGLQQIGPLAVVAGSTFPDYYTKDEVNEIVAGANFSFFLSDTVDAGIGAYFQLFDADTGEVKSSVGPITIAADGTTIKTFITEIGQPTFTVLSEGVLSLDIHAVTTAAPNIKAAQIQWELWKRTHPGGVETKLVTSEEGPDLTNAETHYTLHGVLTEEINLAASDRLVLKVLGNNSGVQPGDPDVTVYMEGDTAARISVQTTITAFDDRYLQLTAAKAMLANLDMGGFAITNVGNVDGVDVSAHKTRHENGGADEIDVTGLSGLLADVQNMPVHALGGAGHSPDTMDNLNAKITDGPLDTTAGERTPSEHNNTHMSAGDDPVRIDELKEGTDVATLDSSVARHGLLKKLPNVAAQFLNGVGTWAVPAGGGGMNFVDRGDPAGLDWTQATLTTDGTWRDLDLSAIVPAGAVAVVLETLIADNSVQLTISYRKKGNVNDRNVSTIYNQVSNFFVHAPSIVPCDTDRKIQYNASNIVWTTIRIVVKGWWIPA